MGSPCRRDRCSFARRVVGRRFCHVDEDLSPKNRGDARAVAGGPVQQAPQMDALEAEPDSPKAGSRHTKSEERSRAVSTQRGLDALRAEPDCPPGRERRLMRSYGSYRARLRPENNRGRDKRGMLRNDREARSEQ